jgi:hypothetical protein
MRSRYLTNLALVLLGGFLIVTSQAFGVGAFTWLMFGSGVGTLAIAAPAIALPSRGLSQRGLDGIYSVLGAWTIVAALVFGGAAVTWLGFASGAALVALAVAGLTLHELSTERVVHSFEVRAGAANGATTSYEPGVPAREPAGVR